MNPKELQPHPLLASMPRIYEEPSVTRSFTDDIASNGILQPVLIVADTTTYVDGARRISAARQLGLDVPVREIPANQAAEAILSSLTQRRHLNKGQLAYLVYPIMEPMIEAAKARRLENLRRGPLDGGCINAASGNGKSWTVDSLALGLGFSARYIGYARQLHLAWESREFKVMEKTYPVTDADREWAESALFEGHGDAAGEEKTTIVSLGNVVAGLGSRVLPNEERNLDRRTNAFSFERIELGLNRYASYLSKEDLFTPGYIDRTRDVLRKSFSELPDTALEEISDAIRLAKRERKGAA